jgi:hypothetical protein
MAFIIPTIEIRVSTMLVLTVLGKWNCDPEVTSEERKLVLNLVKILPLSKTVREGKHHYIGPTCIMAVFYA